MNRSNLPDFAAAIDLYESNAEARSYAEHNHWYWRCIHGGLSLVRKSTLDFEPIKGYWHLAERRLLVAFFTKKLQASYAPADALRQLAFKTFRHFDVARRDGRFGEPQLPVPGSGLWPSVCDTAIEVAAELPRIPEFEALKAVWGRRLVHETLRDELGAFFEAAKAEPAIGSLEPAFYVRIAWFPYLGLDRLEDLEARQRFFYGYYHLWATSNSYIRGGSISFAPVIQNNPTQELLGYAQRWCDGESPADTGFFVEGKREKRDRSHHAPVVELYGFLNLHRIPFNNSVTNAVYAELAEPGDASIFDRLERIGAMTRRYLQEQNGNRSKLADWFRQLTTSPTLHSGLQVEGIRLETVAQTHPGDAAQQVETKLRPELEEGARSRAEALSELDAATAMLHLLVDAAIYQRSLEPRTPGGGPGGGGTGNGGGGPEPLPPVGGSPLTRIPEALRSTAADALGYLRAGYHVLFAGPPATGKTTIAQFVGQAWNAGLDSIPDELAPKDAPVTTVGNSAWAPFHTIGGILPDGSGNFAAARGIFIDPDFAEANEWQLRPECIILDEMNRADLDRCIGELYPLLSGSVERVHPAGIPGVRSVRNHPRFRIIATVNDGTLDDIVFPISEGLARRFVRLELLGATDEDLEHYFAAPGPEAVARRSAALSVIASLREACDDQDLVVTTERGKHLPFGVGYFATVRAWIQGKLELSQEFVERDMRDRAQILVINALTSASRVRGFDGILDKLKATDLAT